MPNFKVAFKKDGTKQLRLPGVNLCDDYEKKRFLNQAIEKVIFQDDYRRFSEFISRFTIDISEIFGNNVLKLQTPK